MSFLWDCFAVVGIFVTLLTCVAFGYHVANLKYRWHR